MTDPAKRKLPSFGPGGKISRNEIMDALADDGYSVDERKDWLKSLLTEVAAYSDDDPEREKLIKEIKDILHEQIHGDPLADDTL